MGPAIEWAVLALRYYLVGCTFTLCSDHTLLQWLHRMKDAITRITCWYLALNGSLTCVGRWGYVAVGAWSGFSCKQRGVTPITGERDRKRDIADTHTPIHTLRRVNLT
ncbi:hypothetical protein PGIGA_G00119300 [Pangasianodon gigas]|uniref:Uncharacterized protein n=1 Tax=Pangasianodon gigas TaxID=30993 RepID=A0ACC5XHV2_PANGG|nr:hypothetical protein [Pangasianodon gigas]